MNDNKELITPNFNFDLCRLAITILDELVLEDSDENKGFIDFIKSLTKDKNGGFASWRFLKCSRNHFFDMFVAYL